MNDTINQSDRPDLAWTRKTDDGYRTTFGKLNDGSVRVTVAQDNGHRVFDVLSADERQSLIAWLQEGLEPDPVYHRCGAQLQHRPADGWDSFDHSGYAFFCPRCSVYTNMSGRA